jgi:hypothetical protein
MTSPFLLDTNAYALLFQSLKTEEHRKLEELIKVEGGMDFFLPEIVCMEIHSVIGKYLRGGVAETQEQCNKSIVIENAISACLHTCYTAKRSRMKARVFKGLQKLMGDIESRNGSIKATVLPTGPEEFSMAKNLLRMFSCRYSFGSHDALVAATVLSARRKGKNITLVTSDKGLKAACRDVGVPIVDPKD